jgi:hypothetical protein
VAKAKSNVCNDSTNRCNEIKPGVGDENRTRVLSLGNCVRYFSGRIVNPDQRWAISSESNPILVYGRTAGLLQTLTHGN